MTPIRILIVDDHGIVRQGLKSLLDLEEDLKVVGEAGTGESAVELMDELLPDIVLLDIRMGDMSGVEVCKAILSKHPDTSIIILTAFYDEENVLQCILAGAKGYVLKDVEIFDLVKAIRTVHRGESVLDPKVAATVMSKLRAASPRAEPDSADFTQKEIEIIKLLAKGLSNKEIGQKIFLSESTVKFHLRKIMEKLKVRDRTAVVYEAMKKGLI